VGLCPKRDQRQAQLSGQPLDASLGHRDVYCRSALQNKTAQAPGHLRPPGGYRAIGKPICAEAWQ
jgi:hypothetical protein